MLSVNDCLILKNGRECAAILANSYFRKIFSNFECRYLGNRLSHSDQPNIIRKLWSSSTNYLFKMLSENDCFTLKNGREYAAILANSYFRKIFSNFERRYLGNRLSHSDQQNIIRKLWSSSTNYLFKMLSVNDCLILKNGRECAAILANSYFRKIFSNFECRYLGNRLSHSDQPNIIRKLWSSSTNYLFKMLSENDCFTLKNGRECAAILAKIGPISALQVF